MAISVNTPLLIGNESKYLQECIDTGWISSEGPFIAKFESGFSQYIGRQYGVAVANGSAALDIAVATLDIGPGDEVIMPAFTIISPALSVIRSGAIPVLVDNDPETWNMDVNQIEQKITRRTKAIIVVHIYGLPVDINPVLALAKKYGLKVIEDAAEMHGQTYYEKKCGSFGDISTFSFYSNKLITTGEGGMVLCDDPDLAERCKRLRNLSFGVEKLRFVHHGLGWNYRMTNIQAALGVAQLEQIDSFLNKKRKIGKFYQENLAFMKDKGYALPIESTAYAANIYWVFGVVAPTPLLKEKIVLHLKKNEIGTRPFFWCIHEQPVFKKMGLFKNESYPVAEKHARNGFYIPSGLGLTNEEQEIIIKEIQHV